MCLKKKSLEINCSESEAQEKWLQESVVSLKFVADSGNQNQMLTSG